METKHLAVFSLALSVASANAQSWTLDTLPSGLVAWWQVEGNAMDATTNHHDGTAAGGVSYPAGWSGSGVAFDGTNDVITVPDSPGLRLTNALTIEFWARRQRMDIDIVLEKGGDWGPVAGGEPNYGVGLHTLYNRMFYFFFRGGWRGTSGVDDLNWHHYAVVATNAAANPVLYIDGVARAVEFSEGATTISLYPTTLPMHIGAQVFPDWDYYGNNVLDDVRLYNRGLTAEEIAYLHSGPPPSGLISWWRGEGDTADALQQHHGTPEGSLTYTNGQVGQGCAFNAVDAAVALGTWFNLQQFTLSFWVNPAASQVQYADLLDNNHDTWRSWVLQHAPTADPQEWLWHAGPELEHTFKLATNRWQHLAVVRDTNRVSRLYLDGRLEGSITNSSPIYYDGSEWLHWGRWGAGGRHFNGRMDELMIFDRPLSADEVATLYASQGGRPSLSVQRSNSVLRLSWLLGGAAYQLEATTNLLSGTWDAVTNVAISTPAGFTLSLPPDNGTQFFRLHRP